MSFADSFERQFLFVLTRSLALIFILGLLSAITIGAFVITDSFLQKTTTKVVPQEVLNAISSTTDENARPESWPPSNSPNKNSDRTVATGIQVPFLLQKHFNTPASSQALQVSLETLPQEHRQAFLDEMTVIVTEAEQQAIDASAAINEYQRLKFRRLQQARLATTELKASWQIYAGLAFGATLLVALFSLILVLLAIERNTRRQQP